jgi:chemotaxis protein methyltransferase CheR
MADETLRSRTPAAPPPIESPEEEHELLLLKQKILQERGFNSPFYKDKCLRRRIAVRMRAQGVTGYATYAALLDERPDEYDRLIDTLTVNVTKFFRNFETWQVIEQRVIPELFARPDARLNCWSAGCSSGEEPYTLSILLHEWARANDRVSDLERVRIHGTDIDHQSLSAARVGIYPELSMVETPLAIRDMWFTGNGPYRLDPAARRIVAFSRHDMISDTPPIARHLIICRNVIIYFDRHIQERIFQMFYEALAPGGILVLGRVETLLGRTRSLFQVIQPRERVFQKPW